MRARVRTPDRVTLEQTYRLVHAPLHWIHSLPEPRDSSTVLAALEKLHPAERLPALMLSPDVPAELAEVLQSLSARGSWDESDRRALRAAYQRWNSIQEKTTARAPSQKQLTSTLDWWARPDEFGEAYLQALYSYQSAFFAEEEWRIRPPLSAALARAQELAETLTLPDLLEELSHGLRFDELPDADDFVLAPSYWGAPILFTGQAGPRSRIYLFGARPPELSLVPGQVVPDGLLRPLKALSDATRLRILHYLAEEPLSPSQLARRLRLRPPTVIHHLRTLRLAGLVQVTVSEDEETKCYAVRAEAVDAACAALRGFVVKPEPTEDS